MSQNKLLETVNFVRLKQMLKAGVLPTDQLTKLQVVHKRLDKKASKKYYTNYYRHTFEGRDIGRLYAKDNSLQKCSRNVRNALSEDIYVDVDMVNSNYNIMENLARYHGIAHRLLKEFNGNRESEMNKFQCVFDVDRDTIKTLFNSIPNSAENDDTIRRWIRKHAPCNKEPNTWLYDLRTEIFEIRRFLLKMEENRKYERYAIENKGIHADNIVGSAFSHLMCDVEFQILSCFTQRARSKHKIKPGVYMHDGCLFEYPNKEIPDEILRDLEAHVYKKLEYKIALKCKALEYDTSILGGEIALYDDIGPSASEIVPASSTTSGFVIDAFLEFTRDKGLVHDEGGNVYIINQDYPYHCDTVDEYSKDKYTTLIKGFTNWCKNTGRSDVLRMYKDKPVEINRNLREYIQICNDDDFPEITFDFHLIGYTDGIWNIKTMEFTNTEDIVDLVYVRRFYEVSFLEVSENLDTPNWDYLLKYQLEDQSTIDIVNGLLGRLFFKVNEMDKYELMVALQGHGGTGKSTIIDAVTGMFLSTNVTTIDKNTSSAFCLEGKDNCQCILIPDATVDLASKLDQQSLQAMITGESVDVNQKNKTHYTVHKWKVPIMIAFNRDLGYKDDGGSFVRRFGCIPWNKPVHKKDLTLKEKISNELPYVFIKIIRAYHALLKLTVNGKSFWDVAPECMRLKQEETNADSNDLACFLSEGPETNRYYVLFKEDACTNLEEFKRIFRMYAKIKFSDKSRSWNNTCDLATLQSHGYFVNRENLCKSCNKPAKQGCCDNYNKHNRYKKVVIKNMELIDTCTLL